MTTKRAQLAKVRASLDPETAEIAKLFFPSKAHELEAQRIQREREETDRTARALALRETRDALLAGTYGAKAKAMAHEYAISHGKDSDETLRYCSALANKARKAEHYKRLAVHQKRTRAI